MIILAMVAACKVHTMKLLDVFAWVLILVMAFFVSNLGDYDSDEYESYKYENREYESQTSEKETTMMGDSEAHVQLYSERKHMIWKKEFADELQSQAENGDAEAQFKLYFLDEKASLKWLCRAADQGHTEAEMWLGYLFETGSYGISRDYAQSYLWYRRAAIGPHQKEIEDKVEKFDPSDHMYFSCKKSKREICRKARKIVELKEKLGAEGMTRAEFLLEQWKPGDCEKGFLKEKAKQGNTEAQWQLYHLHTIEENLVWLCRAADQGQVDAIAELGNLYLYGSDKYRKFQNVHILRDLPRACRWFHLAGLAKITEKTVANIPSRSTIYESAEVKRTAMVMAADELAEAEKLINDWKPGQCEQDFSLSIGIDYVEESELAALCLAADLGKMSAREELGRRYFFGSKNNERDLPHAYMWYHLAAKVYLPPYMPDNQFICDAMTPKQRLIAIKYLEEWKPGMCEQQLLQ